MPIVAEIRRYPVKSLAGERLDMAALHRSTGLSGDRRFALAHGASAFDPAAPRWQPKGHFVNLARTEALAALSARYDPATGLLALEDRETGKTCAADPGTADGQQTLGAWLTERLGIAAKGTVTVARGVPAGFGDAPGGLVSLINLASVGSLAGAMGREIEPARFRGNLLLSELRPWGEMDWPGRTLALGEARLRVLEPIVRCAATHVNPATAARDADVVGALERHFGHVDMGVYAEVIRGGDVSIGDRAEIE